MKAYLINLDSAQDRWASVEKAFSQTSFTVCRISAVNGHALRLPIPEYSEPLYRWFHGRTTAFGQVGCYLSHIKAMQAFLATDDECALIGEDDLTLRPDFEAALAAALAHSKHWNILRLTGLGQSRPLPVAKLFADYRLCIGLGRLKGTGAYLIDRKAARALVTGLLPMRLPIDHAIDREWFFGLRAAYILPFPASQLESGFRTSIHRKGQDIRLSSLRRCFSTYPYQAFNETTRWLFRTRNYLAAR